MLPKLSSTVHPSAQLAAARPNGPLPCACDGMPAGLEPGLPQGCGTGSAGSVAALHMHSTACAVQHGGGFHDGTLHHSRGICLTRALSPFPLTSVTLVAGYGDGGVDIGKQHLGLLRATANTISGHIVELLRSAGAGVCSYCALSS
jgi:hypothetical protein